jgi:DnaJ-class molecular chaperone
MGIDYYEILNVPRNASIFDIKRAYRELALRLHPDRKPNPQCPGAPHLPLPTLPAFINWEALNEAYDVLSDPLQREIYDKHGEEKMKQGVAGNKGYRYHGDCKLTYFQVFGPLSPFCDFILTEIAKLHNANQKVVVKSKDPTIEKVIELDLKEVFHGRVKSVQIQRQEFIDDLEQKTEMREVSLFVRVAPGILEGTRLVYPEAGDRGPTKIPADIVFVVSIKPHESFRRENCDLHTERTITLKEALTGFKLTIATIDDRKLELFITDVVQ